MADIAQLGIAVDTSGPKEAAAALDRMAASARPAEAAVKRLEQASAQAGVSLGRAAAGQNDAARASDAVAASLGRSTAALNANSAAGQRNSNVIALNRGQLQNLGYQINDIASGIAMGQSPFQIMAQQGGQVLQVLQGANGGVTGALKDIAGRVSAILTPARLAGGALAAIGMAGYSAWSAWQARLETMTTALNGVGRASGLTVDNLAKIALQASGPGRLSATQAIDIASGYAGAGINGSMVGGLTASTRNYGKSFGMSTEDAAAELAKAFADPAKGAADLNKRFGFMNATLEETIRRQQQTGDYEGARQTLLREFNTAMNQTTVRTNALSSAMDALTNGISNAWAKIGKALSEPTLQERIDATNARRTRRGVFTLNPGRRNELINQQVGDLQEQQALESQAAWVAKNRIEDNKRSYDVDAAEKMAASGRDAVQVILARTLAEKVLAETQQAYNRTLQDTNSKLQATQAAENARNNALAEATRQLQENLRQSRNELATAGLKPYDKARAQIEQQRIDERERYTGAAAASSGAPAAAAGGPIARIDGLATGFADRLKQMIAAIPGISITSGFRTAEQQADLYRRKPNLAAPQGSSNHEYGLAADLAFADDNARSEAHRRASEFGLRFPLKDRARNPEDWHVEPEGARAQRLAIQNGGAPREVAVGGPRSGDSMVDQTAANRIAALNKDMIEGPFRQAGEELDRLKQKTADSAAMFGKSAGEVAALTKQRELENQMLNLTKTITPEMTAEIAKLAKGFGEAAGAADKLARQQQKSIEFADTIRSTSNDILGSPLKAIGHGEKPGEALRQAGQRAGDRLIDMGVNTLTESLFGPAGKALGGLFGSGDKTTGTMDVKAGIVNIDGGLGGLAKSVTGGDTGSGLSKIFYSIFGGGTGGLYAKGAAFHHGRVIPFADGGVFNQPMSFPMAGGATGVMGEAGPEAIMPLGRGKDGKLGVKAHIPEGRSLPAGLERAIKSISSGSKQRSGINYHAGTTNLNIQGSVTQDTMPKIQQMLEDHSSQQEDRIIKHITRNLAGIQTANANRFAG